MVYFNVLVDLFSSAADPGKPTVRGDEDEEESTETLRFNFNIESLALVLYSSDPKQVSEERLLPPCAGTFSVGFFLLL